MSLNFPRSNSIKDAADTRQLQLKPTKVKTTYSYRERLNKHKTTMAEPEAKRVKTEYELIYWPGIPGRGEVVRLLFEEAGVGYIDTAKAAKAAPTTLSYMAATNLGDDKNPPVFAPPVLKHGELVINQLPNILLYLAPKLGLAPASGDAVYHLNAIALTILDGLCVEVHETHHPIATDKYYEDQKEEAKLRAKAFREQRLPRYLTYVQRLLDGEKSGEGGWLYGGELTYVDLVLFQVSLAVNFDLSSCVVWMLMEYDSALMEHNMLFLRRWRS